MSKSNIGILAVIWLIVLSVAALAWKFVVVPYKTNKKNQDVVEKTTADSRYDWEINFALDSFSGYSILRSQEFKDQLANRRIKMNLVDTPDYTTRIANISDGTAKMGAITIDALLKGIKNTKDLVIVAIVDETVGADAVLAYKSAIPNIDYINSNTKFILTPNSPSETLARVLMANFNIKSNFINISDAEEVYKKYRTSDPNENQVFVLWEPYVNKMLENPNVHIVTDTSKFKGYIVDVIVANRNFLYSNQDLVKKVVESYFLANYYYKDKMSSLIMTDSAVSENQAKSLVNGIWWKNTQENYVHFGLEKGRLQHIEDIIANITKVLIKTDAIKQDPTGGKPNLLYVTTILKAILDEGFHPGIEIVKEDKHLQQLTVKQWDQLIPVGTLQIPNIVFARGSSILTDSSKEVLDELASTLKTCPQYYLIIKGNSSLVGDIEANKTLAAERAKSVEDYLVDRDISNLRIKSYSEVTGKTSVDFILGQLPY